MTGDELKYLLKQYYEEGRWEQGKCYDTIVNFFQWIEKNKGHVVVFNYHHHDVDEYYKE